MDKPTLLMIHGLIGSLDYFDPRACISGASVVTLDLLGYGQYSDVDPNRLTLANQADHVANCIDQLPEGDLWLLGHSMGGAVAVLAAQRRPERVRGIINVEGNLTELDTFWSRKIAAQTPDDWAKQYSVMADDPTAWFLKVGIDPAVLRVDWAEHILANQPASTLYAMSKALLEETLCDEFLETVRHLFDGGMTMHLIAGAKSAAAWGVPDFVRDAAASYTEQPNTGHLMMFEAPTEFGKIVSSILRR